MFYSHKELELDFDEIYMKAAIAQAKKSLREGGIPIGAALVVDNIRNAGRLTPAQYRRATIYTTLSPCAMCSGTILLYKIPRVVIGENVNFQGSEDLLTENKVEVVDLQNKEIEGILTGFIEQHPELWFEDIGKLKSD
jgi:cytosine deaminase